MLINPQEVAGSALGARVAAAIDFTAGAGLGSDISSMKKWWESAGDTDTVNSPKFPDGSGAYAYLFGGCISMQPELGKMVVADDSRHTTAGALRLDQSKGTFVSTGPTTKLGSENVTTLNGLTLNPTSPTLPSSAITPQKTWLPSFIPVFSEISISDVSVMYLTVSLLGKIVRDLIRDKPGQETVSKSRKDLGTVILDNQDFERMILEGAI